MARLLFVEDDPTIRKITSLYLSEKHEVILACDGLEAMEKMKSYDFDLIILDLILPKISGETVAQFAKTKGVPFLMVTAKNAEEDILDGLKLGAIDYITKPFSPRVLVAKIDNFLHRLPRKKLHLDLMACELITKDSTITLTKKEAFLLNELLSAPNSTLTREELLERVWKGEKVSKRIVDATVKNLRKKLQNSPVKLITIFGKGYKVSTEQK